MNKNFKVGQSNELIKEGRIYDLHNCFDFDGLLITGKGVIILMFRPNDSYGVGYSAITIRAQSVDHFEVSPHIGAFIVSDIEEIGYKSRDDNDDNWLLNENQATTADDLYFRFNDGNFVRFHSESVLLFEAPATPDL